MSLNVAGGCEMGMGEGGGCGGGTGGCGRQGSTWSGMLHFSLFLINRLNQTQSATFKFLICTMSPEDLYFGLFCFVFQSEKLRC